MAVSEIHVALMLIQIRFCRNTETRSGLTKHLAQCRENRLSLIINFGLFRDLFVQTLLHIRGVNKRILRDNITYKEYINH